MGFFGAAHADEDFKKSTLRKICHTSYNDETWNSFTLPKNIKKINKSRETLLEFCLHQHFFHQKSARFVRSRNTNIECILIRNF